MSPYRQSTLSVYAPAYPSYYRGEQHFEAPRMRTVPLPSVQTAPVRPAVKERKQVRFDLPSRSHTLATEVVASTSKADTTVYPTAINLAPRTGNSSRAQAAGHAVLSTLLAQHVAHPALIWDMSLPNTTARMPSSLPMPLTHRQRDMPATSPPVSYMSLTLDYLPGPIEISAHRSPSSDPRASSAVVTVGQVLDALYEALHRQIRASDWTLLDERQRDEIVLAYNTRCTRAGTYADWERQQGVKRIDYLRGKTEFRGLVPTGAVNSWAVVVGSVHR